MLVYVCDVLQISMERCAYPACYINGPTKYNIIEVYNLCKLVTLFFVYAVIIKLHYQKRVTLRCHYVDMYFPRGVIQSTYTAGYVYVH